MTGEMKDKLFRTNQAVHSFFRTASSFSSFISQEDRKSTFIFGEALMQIERRFEAHIQHWLLLHPTRIPVLKTASDFYEISAVKKKIALELKQGIHIAYKYGCFLLQ